MQTMGSNKDKLLQEILVLNPKKEVLLLEFLKKFYKNVDTTWLSQRSAASCLETATTIFNQVQKPKTSSFSLFMPKNVPESQPTYLCILSNETIGLELEWIQLFFEKEHLVVGYTHLVKIKRLVSNQATMERLLYIEYEAEHRDLQILEEQMTRHLKDIQKVIQEQEKMQTILSELLPQIPKKDHEIFNFLIQDNFIFLGLTSSNKALGLDLSAYEDLFKTISDSSPIMTTSQPTFYFRHTYITAIQFKTPKDAWKILGIYKQDRSKNDLQSILKNKLPAIMDCNTDEEISEKIGLENLLQLPSCLVLESQPIILMETISHLISQTLSPIRCFLKFNFSTHLGIVIVDIPDERYIYAFQDKIGALLQTHLFRGDYKVERFNLHQVVRLCYLFPSQDVRESCQYQDCVQDIQKHIILTIKLWKDFLLEVLESHPLKKKSLFQRYHQAFPLIYQTLFLDKLDEVIQDIQSIENLSKDKPIDIQLYLDQQSILKCKIFHLHHPIVLSRTFNILEKMGLCIVSEQSISIQPSHQSVVWMHDLILDSHVMNVDKRKDAFKEVFLKIWHERVENDSLNALVLITTMNARDVIILRAYTKYLKQAGIAFDQAYLASILIKYADFSDQLIQLFYANFQPHFTKDRQKSIQDINQNIEKILSTVVQLDEENVLRSFFQLMQAIVRVNFFQDNGKKEWFSFKIASEKCDLLPLPKPCYEIFVYAALMEGIHLRSTTVSRGGIRLSDRSEDFRTEILQLMKAQKVKNAVIVPSGAKGGFICKQDETHSKEDKEALSQRCYQMFISGLLDLTDNIVNEKIIHPKDTLCLDGEDPYLVVAADKGTASYSDMANALAHHYQFWLKDAFASGGALGYNHKELGITAKGAWESIQRHFALAEIDFNQDFTVIGIGGMSGDVFGNGMIFSPHIQLLGAFNHVHIFIDPNPNTMASYQERLRLFQAAASWEDYDASLISSGGGVFSRKQKYIPLSSEMKALLELDVAVLTPNQLIRALLQTKADLLYNGGIGTYVKASTEHHQDIGDKQNDALRVDANMLRFKVIGEGGNLGMTQLARIEYSQCGGHVFADFIDNAAGVNCSDHEVNAKILLHQLMDKGSISFEERNAFLAHMSCHISKLVLFDNREQTRSIQLDLSRAKRDIVLHRHYLNQLESEGKIIRSLEYLPSNLGLKNRKTSGEGLTAPEISLLSMHTKILIKTQLLHSPILDDVERWRAFLFIEFPEILQEKFASEIMIHPLRKEIIATKLSNFMINHMGFMFAYRLQLETQADYPTVAYAYHITAHMLDLCTVIQAIEIMPISSQEKMNKIARLGALARRISRWLIFYYPQQLQHTNADEMKKQWGHMRGLLFQQFSTECGLSEVGDFNYNHYEAQYALLDLWAMHQKYPHTSLEALMTIYAQLDQDYEFSWIKKQILRQGTESVWAILDSALLLDQLDGLQCRFAYLLLDKPSPWAEIPHVKLWMHLLSQLKTETVSTLEMFHVLLHSIRPMMQGMEMGE